MLVKVKFFASLADYIGKPEMDIDISEGATIQSVWELASSNKPIPEGSLCALNHSHVLFSEQIKKGDEIAFFPPMTGG
tara:strand:- start:319 stop:552 length:234 start_codon:yes stop_codon:yes gene_type:complete